MMERLRLTSTAAILELIQVCEEYGQDVEKEEFVPLVQLRKEIEKDLGRIAEEGVPTDMREWINDSIKELKDLENHLKSLDPERKFNFLPAMGKKDFRKYYFQWAVDNPQANSVAIYDPVTKTMRIFKANCA
jgi:hypothetical protein